MNKKWILAMAAVLILAFSLPTAFAALTDTQQKEIQEKQQQIVELRKQIIQQYVDAGQLTPEQGQSMQERMEQMGNCTPGSRAGCGGGGFGGFGFKSNS